MIVAIALKVEKKPTEKKLVTKKSLITKNKAPSKAIDNKKWIITLKTFLYYLEKYISSKLKIFKAKPLDPFLNWFNENYHFFEVLIKMMYHVVAITFDPNIILSLSF